MRKLRELTTRYSLADLVEVVAKAWKEDDIGDNEVVDGATSPEARPEGEREFVKLHKTSKAPIRTGTRPEVFTGANVKKDTSRAGRDPLPGFPPDKWEVKEDLDEQETHALAKGENPWKVWKQTRGETGQSWADFKGAQSKETIGARSSRRLQVGHEINLPGKKQAEAPAAATPEPKGDGGIPAGQARSASASPTPTPFEKKPATPEIKAQTPGVAQSPGQAGPAFKGAGGAARAPSPSASGSADLSGPAKAIGGAALRAVPGIGGVLGTIAKYGINAIGSAKAGTGTAASGLASVPAPPPSQQPSASAVTSTPLGTPTMAAPSKGGLSGAWTSATGKPAVKLRREDIDLRMNYRVAQLSGLIKGLEPELEEAAGVAKLVSKKVDPLIKRPKFDARGNLVLTQAAKQNITQGKKSRKLTGQTYKPSEQKRFGESKEQLDEKNWFHKVGASTPNDEARGTSGKRSTSRTNREKAGPNFAEKTVLVSPKGYKGGGKVSRIPKSQYDPKKHSLAEEQLDEKNWIQGAIKKPGALTAAAHRAKKSVGEFAREHKHSSGKVGKRARLALTLKGLNKEETEQIDELKKSTLASYAKKSASEIATASSFGGAAKRHYKGLNRAIDRLGGTYETGKPLKFKIPGDESNKTYSQQKKKIYHGEETQLDEEADLRRAPRKLAPQEWRIGCMSDFEERKSVQLIEEGMKLDEGGPTKKHFQMAADAIRAIPDENKRKEHAAAHADLYSKQNPRFNREKFYAAAGLKKHQYGPNEGLDEVITKSTPVGDVIHDFVHSKNKVFKGDDKKQRIKRALGAYYGKQRGE